MSNKQVHLSVNPTRFVSSEADLEREHAARTLVLPAVTFQKALALAETRKGFCAPRHQFLPRQTSDFAVALEQALSAKVEVGGARPSSRFTPFNQLREFFEQPAQKRAMAKLRAFVGDGGTMDVRYE